VVDTHDKEGGVVLGGSGDDNLLCTTLDVSATGILVGENTGGLADVVSAGLAPCDTGGILLASDSNEVSVDLDTTFNLLDGAIESA
jgi:hypothetical protein